MRSFRLIDVTHRITRRTQPKDHVFELHVSVQFTPPEPSKTGNMIGIDVGGKHLAVTAVFKEESTIYDMPHKEILREIDTLKSIVTAYKGQTPMEKTKLYDTSKV